MWGAIDDRIARFLREKDNNWKKLREDIQLILDDAHKRGVIPVKYTVVLKRKEDTLDVDIRPALTWYSVSWDMNGDYKEVGPDKEDWPDSVLTTTPFPIEKFKKVFASAWENFRDKVEIANCPSEVRERAEAELLAEVNAQLPFEIEFNWKGYFPKKPYKEIDGCIVVKI